ncbi:MAG: WD40 repeat domain-containing protein [Chloroflexi bacterium]|nr:WD40 repeat domain-containing protein [Chloroflexota bacterium]
MRALVIAFLLIAAFTDGITAQDDVVFTFGRGAPEVIVWDDSGDSFYVKTKSGSVWAYDVATLTGQSSDRVVPEYGYYWNDSMQIVEVEWPSNTGQWLAVTRGAGYYGAVEIYEAGGSEPTAVLRGHLDVQGLRSVAWSNDDSRIVTWDSYGLILVWDTTSFSSLGRIEDHVLTHTYAFSSDSRWIALGDKYGRARVFDTTTGDLVHTFNRARYYALLITWQPDGTYLAVHTYGRATTSKVYREEWVVDIYDTATGKFATSLNYAIPVNSAEWHPDGDYLVAATRDDILIWKPGFWKARRLPIEPPFSAFTSVYFSTDHKSLVANFSNCSHSSHGDIIVMDAKLFAVEQTISCIEKLPPELRQPRISLINRWQPGHSPDGQFQTVNDWGSGFRLVRVAEHEN